MKREWRVSARAAFLAQVLERLKLVGSRLQVGHSAAHFGFPIAALCSATPLTTRDSTYKWRHFGEHVNSRKPNRHVSPTWHLEHAWILRTIDEADRIGTRHLGILPDMGIFMKHYPPAFRARPEVTQFIVDSHEAKIMAEYTIYDVALKMQGHRAEAAMAETLRHAPYANPKRLGDYAPYFRHIQAKFYEMDEECTDPAFAYGEVIDELVRCGWTGTRSSEFEGNC